MPQAGIINPVYDFCYRCEKYNHTDDFDSEMQGFYESIKENWTGLDLVNDIRVKKNDTRG